MKITFVSTIVDPSLPKPIPASKEIPDWYRHIPRYVSGKKSPPTEENSDTSATIKSCMPVLDAITSGYLILSPTDLYISKQDGTTLYHWASHDFITFHGPSQFRGYPKTKEILKEEGGPKFGNPWVVRTPKGYSCLFVTPMHRDLPFTILPGIVDTDVYFNAVNFPFLPDPDFEGLVPRGTPIAQVIPFKRESWSASIEDAHESKEHTRNLMNTRNTITSMFFDKYKKNFWFSKEYK